jgi:uncharacterized protein YndB with AHSA1/START domain
MPATSIEPTVVHSTFVIERSFTVPPERVFAAFANPDIKRRWYADTRRHVVDAFSMDFRVGGVDEARFRSSNETPFPNAVFVNRTTYQNIVPNRRIVMAYTMAFGSETGDKVFSASLATVELVPTADGTQLFFTDQVAFFEGADTPEMRKHGWETLLDSLAAELGQ